MATSSALWAGKEPNYQHFIEVDFFEYDIAEGGNYYGATMHDWYGVYNKTCPGRSFCSVGRAYSDVKTPVRGDFTQYHTYGFLWVPATGSSTGYGQFYFDRTPVGKRVSWTKIAGQDGLPDQQPWQFGILDNHHLVLILGTGVGKPIHRWRQGMLAIFRSPEFAQLTSQSPSGHACRASSRRHPRPPRPMQIHVA